MTSRHWLAAAGAAFVIAAAGSAAKAMPTPSTPVDADIAFVVDQSGSMGGEFSFLGGAISGFLTDLNNDSRINNAQAGLISFESSPTLVQDLTGDATVLSNAFSSVSTFGGRENALEAVDSAIPMGNIDLGLSYRPNSVKTVILITDEDADDDSTAARTDLENLIDNKGFLVNIIADGFAGNFDDEFEQIARPAGALFDIDDFRNDRQGFFQQFTNTKIQEITQTPVPVPATAALFGLGLFALGLAGGYRRHRAG
mgnify:CR=1 FL=1